MYNTPETPENRHETIHKIWARNQWLYGAIGFSLGIMFFPSLSLILSEFEETLKSLFPEAVGIAFTALVIDQIAKNIQKNRLKADWIYRLGSKDNNESMRAREELHREDWLYDGSLNNENLWGANLRDVKLPRAVLQKTIFHRANLRSTSFYQADLQGANLISADLRGANLTDANLKDAKFYFRDQHGRILSELNAIFDSTTKLPNGTSFDPKRTLEEQLDQFTNSDNPNFWRSNQPTSPAYTEAH